MCERQIAQTNQKGRFIATLAEKRQNRDMTSCLLVLPKLFTAISLKHFQWKRKRRPLTFPGFVIVTPSCPRLTGFPTGQGKHLSVQTLSALRKEKLCLSTDAQCLPAFKGPANSVCLVNYVIITSRLWEAEKEAQVEHDLRLRWLGAVLWCSPTGSGSTLKCSGRFWVLLGTKTAWKVQDLLFAVHFRGQNERCVCSARLLSTKTKQDCWVFTWDLSCMQLHVSTLTGSVTILRLFELSPARRKVEWWIGKRSNAFSLEFDEMISRRQTLIIRISMFRCSQASNKLYIGFRIQGKAKACKATKGWESHPCQFVCGVPPRTCLIRLSLHKLDGLLRILTDRSRWRV